MSRSGPSPNDPPPRSQPLRIGIVGAGRSHQGIGPYHAEAFEAAGARVAAVSGRDLVSAQRAATALAARFGHPVTAAPDPRSLAASVDALVVASPHAVHLEGLDAALAAGVPCLCEKPLVSWPDAEAGLARIRQFRDRGLLLVENCQWPFVLPALFALHPDLEGAPIRRVVMGLGPSGAGPAMVADSLSHVLSVVQELAPLDPQCEVRNLRQSNRARDAEANAVTFDLRGATATIAVELHLRRCPEQPRPAWIAVDGQRMDRRIGPDYAQSFVAPDGRAMNVRDPLHQLVYRFASHLEANDRERTTAIAASTALRLRLYADILRDLAADGS
ncbi:MAG TPA: Gfo/Idh/MocA family oxidoreductase [Planctomycetota bacterium]